MSEEPVIGTGWAIGSIEGAILDAARDAQNKLGEPSGPDMERRFLVISTSVEVGGLVGTAFRATVEFEPPTESLAPEPSWSSDGWEAWIDLMPGKTPTVHVVGSCHFPTTGFKAYIERLEPQGFNPRDLLLRLVVEEPGGAVSEVLTDTLVSYSEPAERGQFDTASIVGATGATGIEIKDVH